MMNEASEKTSDLKTTQDKGSVLKRLVIKPCPFCGSEGKKYNIHVVGCSAESYDICGVQPVVMLSTLEKTIKAWNQRAL